MEVEMEVEMEIGMFWLLVMKAQHLAAALQRILAFL
jgi:hypothetical protein